MISDIKYFYVVYPAIAGGNHLCNLLSLHPLFHQRFPSVTYTSDLINLYDERQKLKYSKNKFDDMKKYTKIQLTKSLKFQELSSLMYNAHHWEEAMDNSNLDYNNPIIETRSVKNGETFENLNMWYHNILCKASRSVKNYDRKIYLLLSHGIRRGVSVIPEINNIFVKDFWNSLRNKQNTFAIFMTVPKAKGRAYDRLHQGNPNAVNLLKEENYNIPFKAQVNGAIRNLFDKDNSFCINTDCFLEDDGCAYLQDSLLKYLNIQLPEESYTIHKFWLNMIDQELHELKNYNLLENK